MNSSGVSFARQRTSTYGICKRCGRHRDDHTGPNLKCLFEPTSFYGGTLAEADRELCKLERERREARARATKHAVKSATFAHIYGGTNDTLVKTISRYISPDVTPRQFARAVDEYVGRSAFHGTPSVKRKLMRAFGACRRGTK